jgi:hypothetical protein
MTLIDGDRRETLDTATSRQDAEALIEEARQRQHKRRLWMGSIVLIAIVASGVTYAVASGPSARARNTGGSTKTGSATRSGAFVVPEAPYALAVAPNGDLLAVDARRDQILRRLPSGKFQVLAGDGKRGFSGDGGPRSAPRSTSATRLG